jgi:pilus assembly protein Flp/PilA
VRTRIFAGLHRESMMTDLPTLRQALQRLLRGLSRDTSGATAIEYGLIAAFISVALVAALPTLRQNVLGLFQNVNSSLDRAERVTNGGGKKG